MKGLLLDLPQRAWERARRMADLGLSPGSFGRIRGRWAVSAAYKPNGAKERARRRAQIERGFLTQHNGVQQ